ANMETAGNMNGRQIGDCGVWLIKPDQDDASRFAFGLQDEGGKIDLNSATEDMLVALPGLPQEAADAIVDWRDADSTTSGPGAEDDFYSNISNHPDINEAYKAKNANFESVEELRLVRWMTEDILHGVDANHNGVLDEPAGNQAVGLEAALNTQRGIYPFVTAW